VNAAGSTLGALRVGNIRTLRRREPPPWPPSLKRNLPDSDAGRPRSPCHSANEWPSRGSSEPARVNGMLGQTHRRVNLAATSHPEGTTTSAAPSRSRSGRSGAKLAWGEAGTLPGVAAGKVREDLPDDRGTVQRGDQT
jgi:hypothetical protein